MTAVIAALDVGGSSIKRGLVRGKSDVQLLDTAVVAANSDAATIFEHLAAAAEDVVQIDEQCRHLAVAFPGPFDYDRGIARLRGRSKYEAIYGMELRPELHERMSCDVQISFCHDATAAALGEATAGAARTVDRSLTVTLGTGFGSCFVAAGAPVDCIDGLRTRHLYEHRLPSGALADDALSARGLAAELGVPMRELASVPKDHPDSDAAFERFGDRLGRFLVEIAAKTGPEMIVIGGGASGAFDRFHRSVQRLVDVPTVQAELGPRAALIGVARNHRELS